MNPDPASSRAEAAGTSAQILQLERQERQSLRRPIQDADEFQRAGTRAPWVRFLLSGRPKI